MLGYAVRGGGGGGAARPCAHQPAQEGLICLACDPNYANYFLSTDVNNLTVLHAACAQRCIAAAAPCGPATNPPADATQLSVAQNTCSGLYGGERAGSPTVRA
jgi:hypothetical protein